LADQGRRTPGAAAAKATTRKPRFGAGAVTVLAPFFMVFLWNLGNPSAGDRFHQPALLGVIGIWMVLGGAFGALVGAVHRFIAGAQKMGRSDPVI
jgi:hypothetical protein